MIEFEIAMIILVGLFIFYLSLNFKLVREHEVVVIERLGRFSKLIDKPGIYFITPLLDRVYQTVTTRKESKSFSFNVEEYTYHASYKAKITNVKLFVYGEIDTYQAINDFFVEQYRDYMNINKSLIDQMMEYALERGVEISDINVDN